MTKWVEEVNSQPASAFKGDISLVKIISGCHLDSKLEAYIPRNDEQRKRKEAVKKAAYDWFYGLAKYHNLKSGLGADDPDTKEALDRTAKAKMKLFSLCDSSVDMAEDKPPMAVPSQTSPQLVPSKDSPAVGAPVKPPQSEACKLLEQYLERYQQIIQYSRGADKERRLSDLKLEMLPKLKETLPEGVYVATGKYEAAMECTEMMALSGLPMELIRKTCGQGYTSTTFIKDIKEDILRACQQRSNPMVSSQPQLDHVSPNFVATCTDHCVESNLSSWSQSLASLEELCSHQCFLEALKMDQERRERLDPRYKDFDRKAWKQCIEPCWEEGKRSNYRDFAAFHRCGRRCDKMHHAPEETNPMPVDRCARKCEQLHQPDSVEETKCLQQCVGLK